ncbi:MAG: ABC transporter permease [Pseudomonadota bacterium]
MLRSIYLVARRDYLGYVTAWGFWLGLMITPILFGLGITLPSFAASQTPVRYFAVVDGNGAFERAVEIEMQRRATNTARGMIETTSILVGEGETRAALERFDAAIEAGDTPQAALGEASPQLAGVTIPDGNYALVPAPARDIDGLRPFLTGEQTVDTPHGPKPLFGALIFTGEEVEYWSESTSLSSITGIARRASNAMAREAVFSEENVDPGILERIEARRPSITEKLLREDITQSAEMTIADRAPQFVAVGLTFLLWTLIFSVVNYLLMGTIEERSNKIFDTLLTSVKLPHLLAGKLIAVLAVSLTLMSVWSLGGTAVTVAGFSAMSGEVRDVLGAGVAAALDPAMLFPALISFLLGYLMYGSVFLALGSLCDTIQEAQTLMTPLIILMMVPLFMVTIAMTDPESPIIGAMAWVPIFTPFLLILRMPADPPLWEVFGQLGLMTLTTLAILWVAARVYRAGAVHGAGVNDALGMLKRTVGLGRV